MADYVRAELEVQGPFSPLELAIGSAFDSVAGIDSALLNDAHVASLVLVRTMAQLACTNAPAVEDAMSRFLAIVCSHFSLDSGRVEEGPVPAGEVPSKFTPAGAGAFFWREDHG